MTDRFRAELCRAHLLFALIALAVIAGAVSCARAQGFLDATRSRSVRAIEIVMTAEGGGARGLVDAAAASAGVPAHLAHAVIRTESNYNPRLRGRAGEWGIGQIKCATAREMGLRGHCGQLADAATNLRYAMAYLRRALDRGGTGCAGVSLYQRGLGGRLACSAYGRAVMARAGR